MNYLMMSTDEYWGFNNLVYSGGNKWIFDSSGGVSATVGTWINANDPPPGMRGISIGVFYEDDAYPTLQTIHFETHDGQISSDYDLQEGFHRIEWTYVPLSSNDYVKDIIISGEFGTYYALDGYISKIQFLYENDNVWTDKVKCSEDYWRFA
jgi:hypothetical protein